MISQYEFIQEKTTAQLFTQVFTFFKKIKRERERQTNKRKEKKDKLQ